MENYDIGEIMRMKRKALGYTRAEVCARCGGMSEKTLSRLESGKMKVRRESIEELLRLYHQSSHILCPVLDAENALANRLYLEILLLLYQKNYMEAWRKFEILEADIVPKSEVSKYFMESTKRKLMYIMGQKELDGKETLKFFEELVAGMMPEGADLANWPVNWQEMSIYVDFFNILARQGQYGRIIPIAQKLLVNLEKRYHNIAIFSNFYGCITRRLIRCLFEENLGDQIVQLAEKGLEICAVTGDIVNIYRIQGELINYFWKYDFFQNGKWREQCFEKAKEGYILSAVCENRGVMRYFRRFLEDEYGYMVDGWG